MRGHRYEQFFWLTPIGIRVGHTSRRELKSIPAHHRGRYRRRMIWTSTSDVHDAFHGVRAGQRLGRARKHPKHSKVFHVGKNDWYFARHHRITGVLKVRHRTVQEIGITYRALTRTRAAQRTFLRSFWTRHRRRHHRDP